MYHARGRIFPSPGCELSQLPAASGKRLHVQNQQFLVHRGYSPYDLLSILLQNITLIKLCLNQNVIYETLLTFDKRFLP